MTQATPNAASRADAAPAPHTDTRPSLADVRALFDAPLLELVRRAASVHGQHHDPREVQCSQLLSIKTGGCPEDCSYCPQSAHFETPVERQKLLDVDAVLEAAQSARDGGADRFCMGAAWREVKDGAEFDRVLEMVRGVKKLGLEACVTLGMLESHQAERLADAGLDYYNHNLDTGSSHYGEIVSTRTHTDRLRTLDAVRGAGVHVCTGGILGMGEPVEARAELLWQLASLDPQPESVPINALVAVEGTPLSERPPLDWSELVRAVAIARILIPRAVVRLSAGRTQLDEATQGLCFLAGANSIFVGEELLTTPNPEPKSDAALLRKLGLEPLRRGHDAARP
ncbi:MAG: biotin synthase BioB [Planctomycetaceae bacterium]|nr:biotin synthase BioB [Planctomycetaceae bacterium]